MYFEENLKRSEISRVENGTQRSVRAQKGMTKR